MVRQSSFRGGFSQILVSFMLILAVTLPISGCTSDLVNGTGTITKAEAVKFTQDVNSLTSQVKQYQGMVTALTDSLLKTGKIDANQASQILKFNGSLDTFGTMVQQFGKAVANGNYDNQLSAMQVFVEAMRAGNKSTEAYNPYSVYIEFILGLIATALAIFAKKKMTDAAVSNVKYQSHKQGVEKTIKELAAEGNIEVAKIDTKLYDNIGQARRNNGLNA